MIVLYEKGFVIQKPTLDYQLIVILENSTSAVFSLGKRASHLCPKCSINQENTRRRHQYICIRDCVYFWK